MKKRNLLFIILFLLVSALCLTACKAGETGETGDQGVKGQTGETGATGDKGPEGDQGDKGDKGADGQNAKAPEMQVTEDGVQWRLEGEEEWKTLITIQDLIGYSQKYTISFDANGGKDVAAMTKQVYKTTAELPAAEKDGYTFVGWEDAEGNVATTYTLGASDVTLKAVWGSTVTLSNTALGSTFDLAALTEAGSFKITAFNDITDTFGNELGMATPAKKDTVVGGYWYRILVKEIANGVFEIVDILDASGASTPKEGYDYVIGVHSNCTDGESLAVLKEQIVKDSEGTYKNQIVAIEGFDAAAEKAVTWTAKVYTGYTKNQTVVTVGQTYTLPTLDAKDGKAFLGWTVDKAALVTGEVTPNGDVEYIPVYQYTMTYELNGGTGDATQDVTAYSAELPTPTNGKLTFMGWYAEATYENKVTVTPLQATTLYARWAVPTTVTYDLNGGLWGTAGDYADAVAIRTDLCNDYNAFAGKSYTIEDMTTGSWSPTDFHKFFYSEGMEAKWTWLAEWISVNGAGTSSGKENLNAFKKMLAHQTLGTDNDIYSISYEFRAFIRGTVIREGNASFGTTNYTEEVQAQIFAAYAALKVNKVEEYTAETTVTLVPSKAGYTFAGWYDGDTKVEVIPVAVEACSKTLTAKWIVANEVSYDLDGGQWAGITAIREELCADYNAFAGTSYTIEDMTTGSWSPTNFHTFFYSEGMEAKWTWLAEWISVNGAATSADKENLKAFKKMLAHETLGTDNDIYSISYEFRAFIRGTVIRSGHVSFGTTDYTEEVLAQIWAAYCVANPVYADNAAVYTEAVATLPTPVKEGYTFQGWYNGDTKVEGFEAPTTTVKVTLKAKWALAVAEITLDQIKAELLKDLNAAAGTTATAATFYETFKYKLVGDAEGTDTNGLLQGETLNAKYKWLVEWIEAKNQASDGKGNKRMNGAMTKLGYTYTYSNADLANTYDKYSQQMLAHDLANFLLGADATFVGGFSESSYPPVYFKTAEAYDGVIDAAYAAGFTVAE